MITFTSYCVPCKTDLVWAKNILAKQIKGKGFKVESFEYQHCESPILGSVIQIIAHCQPLDKF